MRGHDEKEFPHLFRNKSNLKDKIHFKWVGL
jgi:hypothetical protein